MQCSFILFHATKMSDDSKLANEESPFVVDVKPPEDVKADSSYLELTDETITDEMIKEFKIIGVDKPPKVSWPRWMGPKDTKQRHAHIIHLAALGMTNRQIALEMEINEQRVSIIINTPHIKAAIADKRREYFGDEAKAYVKSLAHKSLEVVDGILTDSSERSNVRLEAAKYIIDHTIGKSQQNVKVEGSLISDLIVRLDNDIRDASPSPGNNFLDKPKDAIDTFVDDIITTDLVVGKRGTK